MIEWTDTKHVEVEVIPAGVTISDYAEPVGNPDDPTVIGLGIFGDGEGVIIEGTPAELHALVARIAAMLPANVN